MEKKWISFCGINIRKGLTAELPSDVESYWELAMRKQNNAHALTVDLYNKIGVGAKSMIELPAIDD